MCALRSRRIEIARRFETKAQKRWPATVDACAESKCSTASAGGCIIRAGRREEDDDADEPRDRPHAVHVLRDQEPPV